jgi:predicted phosphodiesterase
MQNAIAVISDIHSNFEALTAVLDDVKSQEVSQVVCLGDIVGLCLRSAVVHARGS